MNNELELVRLLNMKIAGNNSTDVNKAIENLIDVKKAKAIIDYQGDTAACDSLLAKTFEVSQQTGYLIYRVFAD